MQYTVSTILARSKRGHAGRLILHSMSFLALCVAVLSLIYALYLYLPGKPVTPSVHTAEDSVVFDDTPLSPVSQFYPHMKFNHNTITYTIGSGCDSAKRDRIHRAFSEMSAQVSALSFQETQGDSDIDIICTPGIKEKPGERAFIAGEGGARGIIPTGRFHIITEGLVYLYDDSKIRLTKVCEYPHVEVHELMHVFGFNHSNDSRSVMYPLLRSCEQTLDASIVLELNRLYAIENAPDLFFRNVSTVKRGIYLDFNLSIQNSGSIDARNISFSVFSEDKLIHHDYIDNLTFGSGVSMRATNLRLKERNPDDIRFVIDSDNSISELDEGNNEAVVLL